MKSLDVFDLSLVALFGRCGDTDLLAGPFDSFAFDLVLNYFDGIVFVAGNFLRLRGGVMGSSSVEVFISLSELTVGV